MEVQSQWSETGNVVGEYFHNMLLSMALRKDYERQINMPEISNILLITTDQQRFDTIHAAGNPHIRTPHLNWLLDSGIHFRRCYTDSPICMAARATIMTGRHGFNQGLTSNNNKVTPIEASSSLPGLLTRQGYQTRAVGKMHFEPNRCNYGFEHMEILEDYYRFMAQHPEYGVPTNHGLGQCEMEPAISTVDESHSLTHWTVDRSIDFLETRDTTRPFFLWTSFSKPHPPWDPCLNYWKLYENAPMPAPVYGNWSQSIGDVPQGFASPTFKNNGADRFDESLLRDIRRAYYACITQIDYNLGQLFARMRVLDVLDKTAILFTSDHGEMLGDHHLGGKCVFFEGSAHVPMLYRPAKGNFDDKERGSSCDRLVCLADILPTCIALAGGRLPEKPVDGLDLLAVHRGQAERPVFFGECENFHCVIEEQHKYTFTPIGAQELLFDLSADPHEQKDLIRTNAAPEILKKLRGRLIERLTQAGHPAVEKGILKATSPTLTPRQVRASPWPGFVSRQQPNEVMH